MEFDQLVQIAGILLNLLLGIGVVPAIRWVQVQLGLGVRSTQVATVAMAVVVSILNMLVTGAITEEQLRPEYFAELLIAVLTASQAEYNRLKRKGHIPP